MSRRYLWAHIRVALPMGFQASIIAIGAILVQFALNRLGAQSVAAFSAAQKIDMVATLPARLARRAVEQGNLAILDLPYEPLRVQFEVIWHERTDQDAGLRWLRAELVEALRE